MFCWLNRVIGFLFNRVFVYLGMRFILHSLCGLLIATVRLNSSALAPIVTASFCGGVRRKRYSEKREQAPDKKKIIWYANCELCKSK